MSSHSSSSSRVKTAKLVALVFLLVPALLVFLLSGRTSSATQAEPLITGLADPQALVNLYEEWKTDYEKNGGDRNLVLPLRWSKGLSSEFTKGAGYVKLDMIDGKVVVEVKGLSATEGWDFWLIANSPDSSVLPDKSDTMLRVGGLQLEEKSLKLQAELGREAFATFRPDLAIITRAGQSPEESRILTGNTSLFHSLYRSAQLGRFGDIDGDDKATAPDTEKPGVFERLLANIMPTAKAQIGPPPGIPAIVAQGRQIFLNEQFQGNGRTCATCHREENNLTIDPIFIATLNPATDALFVAERPGPLTENFEKPELMRNVGLILENVDGFEDLERKFVMRGVPHTLALQTSVRSNLPDFTHALGWSGDGSPTGEVFNLEFQLVPHQSTGSLRDFALGAVRQHFTKTLRRISIQDGGTDFRFPTLDELNKMEAFQFSTGRTSDLQLVPGQRNSLVLRGALANKGQELFSRPFGFFPGRGPLSCNLCHKNAGAIFQGTEGHPDDGFNANLNNRAEDLRIKPGHLIDPTIPRDGGFGKTPGDLRTGFGNQLFNIPTVVESAFTQPLFHNNATNTIEMATQHYMFTFGPDFLSVNGFLGFQMDQGFSPDVVNAIGAFIRVIGALEKIRSADNLERRAAMNEATTTQARRLLQLSQAELNHGINVLVGAQLHPVAVQHMRNAIAHDQTAINAGADVAARNAAIQRALQAKAAAKADMQIQGP